MTESSLRLRIKKKRQEERRRMLALFLGLGIMLLAFGVYFLSQFLSASALQFLRRKFLALISRSLFNLPINHT